MIGEPLSPAVFFYFVFGAAFLIVAFASRPLFFRPSPPVEHSGPWGRATREDRWRWPVYLLAIAVVLFEGLAWLFGYL